MKLGPVTKLYKRKTQTYFLKLHMCVHLRTKFQVSSILVTSFRRGEGCKFTLHTHTPQENP